MAKAPASPANARGPARIEYLKVENYRALRSVELRDITPLSVLLGPNGSGKSTVFDVFNFLSECFQFGLRHAWDRRGRAKELRTRGQSGPVTIEIKYRERPGQPIITYHLAIDEGPKGPSVSSEWLQWRRGAKGKPFRFLDYKDGHGRVVSGEMPDERDERSEKPLRSPDLLAVSTLGQLAEHPRVAALRELITDWHLLRSPKAPRLEGVLAEPMPDSPPPQLIGIEGPENSLHPRLLPELAESYRMATQRSQILAVTYSPLFLNGARPEEVWLLHRNDQGHTQAVRASKLKGVPETVSSGASLGDLWLEGQGAYQ